MSSTHHGARCVDLLAYAPPMDDRAEQLQRTGVAPLPRPTGDGEVKPPHGLVDPMSRRSDSDALRGHFVIVDLSDPNAFAGVERAIGGADRYHGGRPVGVYHTARSSSTTRPASRSPRWLSCAPTSAAAS